MPSGGTDRTKTSSSDQKSAGPQCKSEYLSLKQEYIRNRGRRVQALGCRVCGVYSFQGLGGLHSEYVVPPALGITSLQTLA